MESVNYRKNTRDYRPRATFLKEALSHYGHASKHGAGLHMYDTSEPDRPASLSVFDVGQAREYIKLLQHFVDIRERLDNK